MNLDGMKESEERKGPTNFDEKTLGEEHMKERRKFREQIREKEKKLREAE